MEKNSIERDIEGIFEQRSRKNKKDEFSRKRNARIQRRLATRGIWLGVISLIFGICSIFGWIVNWIAIPVFSVASVLSAVTFGRFFENVKCWGNCVDG